MYRKLEKIVFLLVLLGLLLASSQLWAESLLAKPADISPRAGKSVLLSLAQAGDRLVAVGERGFALTSDDHGLTWHQAQVPVSVTLTTVFFATPEKGWAVGHGGVVLNSDDGGRTWKKLLDGTQAAAIELEAAKHADNAESRQNERRVRNAQWLVNSGPDKPFLSVHFFDSRRGLIVGAYGLIFATEDGGKSWRSLMGNVPNPMGLHLYDICIVGRDVYVVGEQGIVFRASDDWEQFEKIETPYKGSFFGMQSSLNGDLLLFGLRGHVLRSSDRGESWHWVDMPQPVTLTAGTRLGNGDLVLVNETGAVLRSTDDGKHFNPVSVENASLFTDVLQSADGALITSGIRGTTRIELQNNSGNS
ncbi:YCF48-related protein [Desulfuromonas sp. TF]|uniref:WD40/YVTN/BNR-like repeat-containing protein n=1 Tax=Desulfuromonas sp. TF TaxID=1232410 RepID=UPI000417974B|nr:YCF48-related protein [Desulfuromonas sp. TF]